MRLPPLLTVWPSLIVWFVLVSGQPGALAQDLRQLASFKAWTLYHHGASNLCFIDSMPVSSRGNKRPRQKTRAQVTSYPNRETETNLHIGIQLGAQRLVSVNIDDRYFFDFYSAGEIAWPKTTKENQRLVTAMRRGKVMRVTATPLNGGAVNDIYSLLGFTRAFRRLGDCQAKGG